MTDYRDLLPVVVETSGAQMPEGFNSWGIKTVLPDLSTTRNFRWAMPGGVNVSNDHLLLDNTSACPKKPGDGLCVATTWQGMASGGISALTLLLVAYRAADVVGRDEPAGKLRIGGEVASVALIDGERLIREHGRGAYLRGARLLYAYLQGADLRGADLQGAYLQGARLQGADLRGARLRRADLRGAVLRDTNLWGADLWGADLSGADLQRADLWGAYLQLANLRGARLRRADLRGAVLRDTNLKYADLWGADLSGADLWGADLQGAVWPSSIAPPDGWTLTISGLLTRDDGRPADLQDEGMKQ